MSPWASGDSLTPSTLNRVVPSWVSTVVSEYAVVGLVDDGGATDGTSLIQAQMNAATAAGGGIVRLPATRLGFGVSHLTGGNGVVLQGGSGSSTGLGMTHLVQVSGATNPVLHTDYPSSSTAIGDRVFGFRIKDISVAPLSSNTGLALRFGSWCAVDNFHVVGGLTGVHLSDLWDSDLHRVIVQSASEGVVIDNRGDIDNTNNIHFHHLHAESNAISGVRIDGATGFLNNKLYFVGLKLEGLSGSNTSALFQARHARNIHVVGGHNTFKGTDSPTSQAAAIWLDGDVIDASFVDVNLTNNGAVAPFAQYIRITNGSGNNSNCRFVVDVRHTVSSLLSGVVNAPNGSHASMVFVFSRNDVAAASLLTYAPSSLVRSTAYDEAGQAVTNLTVMSDLTNDNSLRLVRTDRSDQWYIGRMQTSGTTQSKVRVLHEELPVLSFEADNTVGINNGLRVSAGSLNLTGASLSVKTTGTSLSSSAISVNELAFFVGGASGATLALRSGGTIYFFASSSSTVG